MKKRWIGFALLAIAALPDAFAAKSTRQWKEALPNFKGKMTVGEIQAGSGREIDLKIQHGWKINDQAPTWAAFFRMDPSGPTFVREWTRDEIKAAKSLVLPEMLKGENYRFQGSFYICEIRKPKVCVVKSSSFEIHARENGAQKALIELNQR